MYLGNAFCRGLCGNVPIQEGVAVMATAGFQIVDGPSREELVDAFKYAMDDRDFSVQFHLVVGHFINTDGTVFGENVNAFRADIMGLTHDSASGDNIIVVCYLNEKLVGSQETTKVEAHYNIETRKGIVVPL